MKLFFLRKGGKPIVKEAKDKADLLRRLVDNDYDPAEFQILTPQEYMENETKSARLEQIKADNPQLSIMFPRTAQKLAETGERSMGKHGSDDMLSLGAREALFEALSMPDNKYVAQDRTARKLTSIEGNEYKRQVQEYLKDFDEAFNENFSDRIKWMNIANQLGEQAPGGKFQLKDDNNFFTGKGIRKPLTDNLTGRTISSAVKKLEKARAKPEAPAKWYRYSDGGAGGFRGNPMTPQQQEMRDLIVEMYGEKAGENYEMSLEQSQEVPYETILESNQRKGEK